MNKNFTKKDIKAGYIVKMRNGSLNMVMIDDDDKLFTVDKNGGWTHLSNYDKNLNHSGDRCCWPNKEYDIMEVYGCCRRHYNALALETEDRQLLWKREEPPKKTCDDCIHKVVCSHVGMCEYFADEK